MKAISILQPWPVAILRLGKNVENRSWRLPAGIVGQRVAVHASKRLDVHETVSFIGLAQRIARRSDAYGQALRDGVAGQDPLLEAELRRRCGFILGTALVLGDCDEEGNFEPARSTDPRLAAAGASPWLVGQYGHVYAEPVWFERPVGPVRGALGYWNVNEELEVAVLQAEAETLGVNVPLVPSAMRLGQLRDISRRPGRAAGYGTRAALDHAADAAGGTK